MKVFTKSRAAALAAAVAVSLVATAPAAQAASKKGKATGKITIFLPVGERYLCTAIKITSVTLSKDGGATSTVATLKYKSRSNYSKTLGAFPESKKAYCDITWRAKGMAAGRYQITYTLTGLNENSAGLAIPNAWFMGGKTTSSATKYPLLSALDGTRYSGITSDVSAIPGTLSFTTVGTIKVKKNGTKQVKKLAMSFNMGLMS